MYKVSFTGYRPQKLPFFGEDDPMCVELKQRISKEIYKLFESGAVDFYSGMALGVDIWCAEEVVRLREKNQNVRLTAVIPCRGQDSRWSKEEQERYHNILRQCDKVLCLSETYTPDCMKKRNIALVDICDVLLAVFDGKPGGTKQTVDYAKKRGRRLVVLSPM